MIYWETKNMMERPGEMEYGKNIINQRHTKNRKDCGKTEDSLNYTVKLRSGNNHGWRRDVSLPAAIQICIQQRRDNFKYCQLVDSGDVVTATESFSLKLKTEKLTEGALSFINTAYRSIIITSKMTQVLLQLAKSLQPKLCAHFHNNLISLQREFICGLCSGNSKWSARHLILIVCCGRMGMGGRGLHCPDYFSNSCVLL